MEIPRFAGEYGKIESIGATEMSRFAERGFAYGLSFGGYTDCGCNRSGIIGTQNIAIHCSQHGEKCGSGEKLKKYVDG